VNKDKGFIVLHRKLSDHWLWSDRPFTKGQAWIDILWECNHTERPVLIKSTVIICKIGECLNSLDTWSKRWGWSKSKVRRFLELLKKENMIELKPTQQTTHISIVNYGTYQTQRNSKKTQTKRKRNGSETEVALNNELNNANHLNNEEEKDKKEIIPLPSEQELKQIFFTELVKKCKKRNISYRDLNYNRAMDQFDVYVDYCKKYHGTAKSYSDYPGASRTFMRELDKLVLKSYEDNTKELPDFTICGGVYKAIEEDDDMNRYMCIKCGNKEMYKPEKCLRDVK
jgi:predicted RNA-binding Zn-ribbon protein involved in translation (DUF1610 family)